jgi:hypothetical protein
LKIIGSSVGKKYIFSYNSEAVLPAEIDLEQKRRGNIQLRDKIVRKNQTWFILLNL